MESGFLLLLLLLFLSFKNPISVFTEIDSYETRIGVDIQSHAITKNKSTYPTMRTLLLVFKTSLSFEIPLQQTYC